MLRRYAGVVIDWGTLVAAAIGGLFGVGAAVGAVELQRRRQSVQWQREILTQASSDTLRLMQRYMREILSLAYTDCPPYTRKVIDGVEHVFPGADSRLPEQNTFDQVISDWNGALHQLLITAPPRLVALSRDLDKELDRLLDLAIENRRSREAFRAERVRSGRLAAEFVEEARRATGAAPFPIENVWTWAEEKATP